MNKGRHQKGFLFSAITVVIAVMGGFAIADFGILIVRTPRLLQPDHLKGFFNLALSAGVFYIGAAIVCLGFACILYLFSRIFGHKPGGAATVLAAVITGPPFMMVLKSFQSRILGTYLSLNSPLFIVPIAIAFVLLLIATGLLIFLFRRLKVLPSLLPSRARFLKLMAAAAIALTVLVLITEPKLNVLGVFSEEEERRVAKEHKPEAPAEVPEDAPSFIYVVIECLRSDSFNHESAPFLWKLASENFYFSRYYVASPATRPSVTSMFTSLYPVQHGCYNLAGGRTAAGGRMLIRVPEIAEPLPRILQEYGYRTVMVTSNSLTMDSSFGFENNFYLFDAEYPYRFQFPYLEAFHGFRFLRTNLHFFRIFKVLFFSPEHSTTYFDGPRINKTVKRELSRDDDRPFFFYIHYIEPHSPYYRHPYRPMQINLYLPSRREEILEAYRSEIRAVDSVISDLFSYLQDKGLLENTYILITSDHGEEFADHGNWGHGKTLFPEVLHVPAVLVPPPSLRRPVRVDEIVECIDLPPTFAKLAGVPEGETWQGESLLPMVGMGEGGQHAQARLNGFDVSGLALSQFDDGHTFQASVIAESLQVILRLKGNDKKVSLYNLASDPGAKTDIFEKGSEVGSIMLDLLETTLRSLYEDAGRIRGGKEVMDEKLMEQLRTLGYID